MATNQESISMDINQKKEIQRYMQYTGITSLSGAVRSLIHKGLNCNGCSGNDGEGVEINNSVSSKENVKINYSKEETPSCFGMPGTGDCEKPCPYKLSCAINYSNSFNK